MPPVTQQSVHAGAADPEPAGRFDGIRQFARGGRRAPNKPLLLLYALSSARLYPGCYLGQSGTHSKDH